MHRLKDEHKCIAIFWLGCLQQLNIKSAWMSGCYAHTNYIRYPFLMQHSIYCNHTNVHTVTHLR